MQLRCSGHLRRLLCGAVGAVALSFALCYLVEGAQAGLKLAQPRTTLSP